MPSYTLSQLAHAMGGTCINPQELLVSYLLTDSRSLAFPAQTLFFALVTSHGNGHSYIEPLYKRGVRAFVVSQEPEYTHFPFASFIVVPNTLAALQQVAGWHRSKLTMPVIGVTGSNGKTTFKELLYQLLSHCYKVGRSPKSYNSSIGVPLSLWGVEPTAEYAIIEAGISEPHEMAPLEAIIRPEIGVFTNIGDAHQENFATLRQKAEEKATLFRHAHTIIYNKDDCNVASVVEELYCGKELLSWSHQESSATLYVEEEHIATQHHGLTEVQVRVGGQSYAFQLPFIDQGTLENLYPAMILLSRVAPHLLSNATLFAELRSVSMRLEVVQGDADTLLINDTYSLDLISLKIALDFMQRRNYEARPTALVLSPASSANEQPVQHYQALGNLLREYSLNQLFLVGEAFGAYVQYFPKGAKVIPSVEAFLAEEKLHLRGHIVLLKGAREARFERIVAQLQKQTHQTILDVNLSKIAHNLKQHKALLPQGTKVVCMIKADGYGVGSYQMARTLQAAGVDYFAVALVDEGKELRERGITTPIIVMNPEAGSLEQLLQYQLEPEIYSLQLLQRFTHTVLASAYDYYPIHLKWDTGMHRLGLNEEELPACVQLLQESRAVRVASVFTHLSVADDPSEDAYTLMQLSTIHSIHKKLTEALGYSPLLHALNTAGSLRFPQWAGNMVRLGIGLYGINPIAEVKDFGLELVAELRTPLLQVRSLPAGATIGYGRKGVVHRPSRIGVIPIGYADGISRQLGNGHITFLTADGTLVPTIGNICMDTLMLDLTDAPATLQAGDLITIFGPQLPITRLSKVCGTIPYEILSRLSARITRRYFSEE